MIVNTKQENKFTTQETELADIGKLLSHPARIKILNILQKNIHMSSTEIASQVPLARTTVLQHISALKEGNWLETTTDGTNINYQINSKFFSTVSNILEMFFLNCSKSNKQLETPTNILFICTGNSCRSQMAEGFINNVSEKYNVKAYSAGTKPSSNIQKLAIEVMAEKNINISDQYPKTTDEFIGDKSIDLVIIVCEQAEKECPYLFPFSKHKIYMPFKDPKTEIEFRDVRDQIESKMNKLLEELQ